MVSCSVWPPSLLEAAFFFCYSSTALAGGYSCVTLTLTLWLILLTCPSQILLPDTACIPFALGVLPSLPRRVFLIIFSRLMELGDRGQARLH